MKNPISKFAPALLLTLLIIFGCKKDPCEGLTCQSGVMEIVTDESCCFTLHAETIEVVATTNPGSDIKYLDMDEDGANDLELKVTYGVSPGTGQTYTSSLTTLGEAEVVVDSQNRLKNFDAGQTVISTNETWQDDYWWLATRNSYQGSLSNWGSGTIAIRIPDGAGNFTYGWVNVSATSESVTLTNWAYESP